MDGEVATDLSDPRKLKPEPIGRTAKSKAGFTLESFLTNYSEYERQEGVIKKRIRCKHA